MSFYLAFQFRCYVSFAKKGFVVQCPKHFLTDLGSIPHLLEFAIANDDPDVIEGAVLHDFGYQTKGELTLGDFYTRRQIDSLLRVGMQSTTSVIIGLMDAGSMWRKIKILFLRFHYFYRRWIVWIMVRMFGWIVWNRYREQELTRASVYIKASTYRPE